MKRKSILVTGCAGFIGSNFVSTFKRKFPKIEIVGIDDLSTGRKELLDKKMKFYKGSINDSVILDKIFNKHTPEYVFHFAALPRISYSIAEPAKTTMVNIGGTVSLLEKSVKYKVKRFIFSSSSSVYGNNKILPTEEDKNDPNPVSPYALQKYVCEKFCKMMSEIYGIDTVSLRYFTVFGPGQFGDSPYSTIICAWLTSLYFPKKKKSFLEGDGKQSRDFCYVDNVVQANIKAMNYKKRFNGESFNIAYGQRTSLLDVKKLIEKHTGKKLILEKRPNRIGDVKHTHASIGKAKKTFGYTPTDDFEAGLKKTIEWFKKMP